MKILFRVILLIVINFACLAMLVSAGQLVDIGVELDSFFIMVLFMCAAFACFWNSSMTFLAIRYVIRKIR